MAIQTRIKELRYVPAHELLRNPENWRRHPAAQQSALASMLDRIGYADALIARETDDGLMLIDGHLRADTTPGQPVPVLVTDLSEDEARELLATLDPLASLAETDSAALTALLEQLTLPDELQERLEALAEDAAPWSYDPDAVERVPVANTGLKVRIVVTCAQSEEDAVRRALDVALSAFRTVETKG